jgi:RNA polymerase sigma-70 factor (ECF subfamily)
MPEFRYDPAVCSFKGWLMHITRCRIIDVYRKRPAKLRILEPLPSDGTTTGQGLQIPDAAAERAFEGMWEQEWEKNLMDAAMERVKRTVKPEQYQIFYLLKSKNMAAKDIAQLMGVSATKVYVVAHRVSHLVKREIGRLSREEMPMGTVPQRKSQKVTHHPDL